MFAHFVELQHQCLHGSAFKSAKANRLIGTLLGMPMLVSFSHYRVTHLYHHRFLGTEQDREFFQYDSSSRLTLGRLLRSAFNVARYAKLARNAWGAWHGRSPADCEGAPEHIKAHIMGEYRLMTGGLGVALALALVGYAPAVAMLWLLPLLLVAEPLHLLIELPEHILCNASVKDPFFNTRTIKGSRLSFWFTNGNNFHSEHHFMPGVPIHELPRLHVEVKDRLTVYERSYPAFYRRILTVAWQNTFRGVSLAGKGPP
jgi:fatty acid desaturase